MDLEPYAFACKFVVCIVLTEYMYISSQHFWSTPRLPFDHCSLMGLTRLVRASLVTTCGLEKRAPDALSLFSVIRG
jgi:hypothetical protein